MPLMPNSARPHWYFVVTRHETLDPLDAIHTATRQARVERAVTTHNETHPDTVLFYYDQRDDPAFIDLVVWSFDLDYLEAALDLLPEDVVHDFDIEIHEARPHPHGH